MYIFDSFCLIHSYNPSIPICLCFNMVSFRGQKKLGSRPDRSPLGVYFKIPDEHSHPFHMRSPPPPRALLVAAGSVIISFSTVIWSLHMYFPFLSVLNFTTTYLKNNLFIKKKKKVLP